MAKTSKEKYAASKAKNEARKGRNQILRDRVDKLIAIRNNSKYFAACVNHYRTHPWDFISDWMMTHDPRKKPAIMPFTLWQRQKEFVQWLYKRWMQREDGLCEKSRDSGMTWICAAFAVWMWIFHEAQVIGFGSRKEDLVDKKGDPNCIFEKIRFLIRNLPKEFIPQEFEIAKHDNYMRLINPANESVIFGEGGYNIGRGGRSSIFFKDESAFYEQPDVIEASLSQNSDVKIDISTPNGVGNPFYRKRHSGVIPVFTFHWRDDPRKDDAWYEKQKMLLDPVILAQEVDIDYNASIDNAFVDPEHVEHAIHNRPSDFDLFNVPLVLGVDVARYGADKSVICARQGRVCHWYRAYAKMDTMSLVGEVRNIVEFSNIKVNGIFVDVVGLGAGVFDRLHEVYGGKVIPVSAGERSAFTHYKNKRTECWALMRAWFKDEPVSIPNDNALRTEICSLQYSYNSAGQLELESKDAAKKRGVKSPDIADSLSLTFALPHDLLYEDDEMVESGDHLAGRSQVTGY